MPANEDIDDKDRHIIVREGLLIGPEDRFRIKTCIGEGTFGKVVSAQDRQREDREVAIKIVRTIDKYRDAARAEIKVLRTIARFDPDDKSGCVRLSDSFEWRGHVCMLFPRYGLSLYDFLKKNNYKPFRPTEVANFGLQLCLAVAFLHDLTLVHTDLKPENILLVRSETITEKSRRADLFITDSSKEGPRQVPISFSVKLIDFGSATFNERYHSTVVATRHYRAPEVLLELGWSYPCDMWAIGAILLELYTGDALFQVHDNHEHLAMIERALRKPFPTHMVRDAAQANPSNTSKYFNSRHELRPLESGSSASRRVRDMLTPHEVFRNASGQQADFYDLLMHLLHYEPTSRWRAREALSHRFFDKVRQQRPSLEQFSQRRTYDEIVAVMENNAELQGVGSEAERKAKHAASEGRVSDRRQRERDRKRDAGERSGERKRDGDGERKRDDDGERKRDGDGERKRDGDGERKRDGDGERKRDGDDERKRDERRDGGEAKKRRDDDDNDKEARNNGASTANDGESRSAPEKRNAASSSSTKASGDAKRRRAGDVDDSAAAHDDASLANENHTPVSEMIEF
jgi:serine/threonine protein kinase